MADSVSLTEAVAFLEGTLHIKSPLDKLKEDRVGFLNDLIIALHQRVPFQSVTAIATPKPERRRLTFEEIKANTMTCQGGFCWENNWFMKVLLESLGFEAYHVACSAVRKVENHLTTVVKNLSQHGDLHFVDVSNGFPTFRPVPLNFDEQSPIYHDSFLTHRFTKEADGTIHWRQKAHPDFIPAPGMDIVDGWFTFMVFKLEFRNIEYFASKFENVRTIESGPEALTPFLLSPRAVDFRNGRLFAIRDATILEEDDNGEVTKRRLSSSEELLEAYRVYYPQIPSEMVQKALQTVNITFHG